jgi:hypothetical protein
MSSVGGLVGSARSPVPARPDPPTARGAPTVAATARNAPAGGSATQRLAAAAVVPGRALACLALYVLRDLIISSAPT